MDNREDAIDVITLLTKLLKAKKTIFKFIIAFIFLGLFVSIFSEPEYKASITIVPQSATKNGGGSLSGLAALAGVNLGGVGEQNGISPQLYPQIIKNISFKKELLGSLISIKGHEKRVTYKEYYNSIYKASLLSTLKEYTIGLPRLIINSLRSSEAKVNKFELKDSIISVSKNDAELMDLLSKQLILNVNDKEGYVTLIGALPEAKASAEFVKSAQKLLEKYVINFKIKKSISQFNFIKKRFNEKKIEFQVIQNKLSDYSDKNQNVNSARAKTRLMNLQSEYDLTFGVYSELAKQLAAQELKVKENTPVFTIIEPVYIPLERSKPKRVSILVMWTLFGLALSIAWVLLKEPFYTLLRKLNYGS